MYDIYALVISVILIYFLSVLRLSNDQHRVLEALTHVDSADGLPAECHGEAQENVLENILLRFQVDCKFDRSIPCRG